MPSKTRYACRFCGDDKMVSGQSPLSPTREIRTGCDHCESLTPHHPVGQPEVRT